MGTCFAEALTRKAREGVEVYAAFDGAVPTRVEARKSNTQATVLEVKELKRE